MACAVTTTVSPLQSRMKKPNTIHVQQKGALGKPCLLWQFFLTYILTGAYGKLSDWHMHRVLRDTTQRVPELALWTRFGMTQRLRELGQVEVGGEEEMTKNPESLTWRGRNKSKQHLHLSRQSMTNFLLLRHSSLSYTVVYHPPKRPMSGEAFHWDSLSMLLWVWVIVSIVIISQPTPESRVTADAKPSERTSTFCKSG